MYDTFTVTHFNRTTGRGQAEQTASAMGFPLCTERLSFSTGVGNGICEYFLDGKDTGICIPSEQIAQRVPEVGTVIMGCIAFDPSVKKTAIGEDDYPGAEADNEVTMDMVLARAHAAFPNNPEQAAEAARMCPGDFI